MVSENEELAFTDDLVQGMQKKEPVKPLVHRTDMDLIDVKASQDHAECLRYLNSYLILAEDETDLDETTAPKRLAQLSHGYRKAGEYAAAANAAWKNAKFDTKRAQAVAALDNFRTYISAKKDEGVTIKTTDEMAKHYINIDPDVKEAVERENLLEAFREQLLTIKFEFSMAIANVRAIIYGHKDSTMISGMSLPVSGEE